MSAIGSAVVGSRRAARVVALVAATLLACGAASLGAAGAARGAESLYPPVRMEINGQYDISSSGGQNESYSWTAYSVSYYDEIGAIFAGPLIYTSDSGVDQGKAWGMPLKNEIPNQWSIGTEGPWPEPGSKYVVAVKWYDLFGSWSQYEEPEEAARPIQMGNYFPEATKEEFDEAFSKIDVAPGGSATVTKSGTGSESGNTENLTVTVTVTSGTGTKHESPPPKEGPSKGGSPPPPPKQEPSKKPEEEKKKEKEAADGRLPQESDWASATHAAENAGGALGALASALAKSADSTLAKDEQTVKDPPLWDVSKLAAPRAVAAKAPACAGAYRKASRRCAKLRKAEKALLKASGEVAAVTAAQYTTISRQSGAIAAGDSSAAEAQATNFSKLEGELRQDLAAQAKAGRKVAALLRRAHVHGRLSKSQMAKGIRALRKSLRKQGLTGAEIGSLPSSALRAKATDFLTALSRGEG